MSGNHTPNQQIGSKSGTPSGSIRGEKMNDEKLPPLNKSGHQGSYSEQQKEILKDFENQLKQENLLQDSYLYETEDQLNIILGRYLRAREWNVENAKKMYKDTLEWRKEVDIDQLIKPKEEGGYDFEERETVANLGWKMYFHSTDKYNRPIFIQDLSNLQVHQVFENTTPDRIIKFFACNLEDAIRKKYRACTNVARRQAREKGEITTKEEEEKIIVDDNFMILNVEGLGMTTFWSFKNKLQQLLAILDANYPELSGRVQIINAPWLFTTIWGYIKVWLPPNTAAKIDIAGVDYEKTLLEYIEKDDLPVDLGGTCSKCKDIPGGCPFSNLGPWQNPENLISTISEQQANGEQPSTKTTDQNGSTVLENVEAK